MKYPKDAYYLNSALKNQKKNGEVFDDGFLNMVEVLKERDLNVFEVGFDFGQRLLHLQEQGVMVVGGVEFDPTFGLYKKHSNLFDHGWNIRFTQLDFWNPCFQKCVITNHFLDIFPAKDQLVLLDKLKGMSEILVMNENVELDIPKENGLYVFEGGPKNQVDNKVELPDFEFLKNKKEENAGDNN